MYVCLCPRTCKGVHEHLCTYVWSPEDKLLCHSRRCYPPFAGRMRSLIGSELDKKARMAGQQAPLSWCSAVPGLEFQGYAMSCHHGQIFLCDFWESNPGSYVGTWLKELSPRSIFQRLWVRVISSTNRGTIWWLPFLHVSLSFLLFNYSS